jgi:hypothetical protein
MYHHKSKESFCNNLKSEIIKNKISNYKNSYSELNYYDLVEVLVDEKGEPLLYTEHGKENAPYLIFTQAHFISRLNRTHALDEIILGQFENHNEQSYSTKKFMLGDLISKNKNRNSLQCIKVNPVLHIDNQTNEKVLLCEDVIISPIFDSLTNKWMVTDPEEGLALLAINPADESRMGIEMVYYCVTNKTLPESGEERAVALHEKIEELSFISSKVPIKKGAGSLFCAIINLGNPIEEAAFIRSYKTFDNHSDIIFVTSSLKILTGQMEEIPFNGDSIDTIFMPIINWQKQAQSQSRL